MKQVLWEVVEEQKRTNDKLLFISPILPQTNIALTSTCTHLHLHSPLPSRCVIYPPPPSLPPPCNYTAMVDSRLQPTTQHPQQITFFPDLLALPNNLRNYEYDVRWIQNDKLTEPDSLVEKYSYLVSTQNAPGALAQFLARKAVFGDDYLIKCISSGSSSYLAVAQCQLFLLKKIIFKL